MIQGGVPIRSSHAEISAEEYERQRAYADAVRLLPKRPRSYCVVTYGCQMNAHDGEKLAGLLRSMEMTEDTKEHADVVIFNTCCVRENAERRALGNVKWMAQRKKEQPDFLLGVCGCMAQEAGGPAEAARMFPEADFIFGTHNLHRLPEYLLRALTECGQVSEILDDEGACIAEDVPSVRGVKHRAFINIMFGCDNFCSYCIVPYVRGRERSRAADAILREAEELVADGVQEIMLLGQNVNSYGHGREDGASFAALLRRLDAIGVPRIRFMTSHPKDLSDELIEAMADGRGIARHIHLPVQSGSNAVLRAMNRGYSREDYLTKVRKLRGAMPDVGLTSDLIVGFPGESDADFADTLALAEEARFDAAYTFIYSPRKGTRAAELPGRIDPETGAARISRLIEAQERGTQAAFKSLIGTRQTVLADEISRRDKAHVSGKCGRNISVSFPGDAGVIGKFVDVTITSAGHNTIKGE